MSKKKRSDADQSDTANADAPDAPEDAGDLTQGEALALTRQPPEREEGESDRAFDDRRAAFAKQELTRAEQETAVRFQKQPGESDADYQARIDDFEVRGHSDTPIDPEYVMPETPTVDDQRAYLVHYGLVTAQEAGLLGADDVGLRIAQHAQDRKAEQEQRAMRAGEGAAPDVLPVNATLDQLRTFVTVNGLATADQAERFGVLELAALVQAKVAQKIDARQTQDPALANVQSVDVSQLPPGGEVSEQRWGGDAPRFFVITEDKMLQIDGHAVTLKSGQQINDRSFDIDFLKRHQVRMVQTVEQAPAY